MITEAQLEADWRALGTRLRTTAPDAYAALLVVMRHVADGTEPTLNEMDELDEVLGERLPRWRVLLGAEL